MANNTVPAHEVAWRAANPAPIKRTIGRYQLLDLLGAGAMGTVYRGKDPDLGRQVAVKLMSPAVSADPQLRDRFHREARTAGSLQHPNIITIYEFGEVNGQLYIAMEYVAGKDLTEVIAEQAPLNLLAKLGIGLDILAGLEYAHSRGITHRDIKPGNIRLTAEGRAKVMDFGIAHLAESELTNTGLVLGTPSYMAPELLKGGDPSRATDIFSAGAVLYELLTLKRPFEGDTTHAVLYKVLSEDPEPVHQIDPSVPRRVREIVRKAMAKVPETRYQTADAMAAELKAACIAISTADDSTVVVRPHRRTLRGRAKSALAVAVTGLGIFAAWDAPVQVPAGRRTPSLAPIQAAIPPPRLRQSVVTDTMLVAVRNQALDLRFQARSAGVPVTMLAAGDRLAGTADSLENTGDHAGAARALSNAGASWARAESDYRAFVRETARQRAQELAAQSAIDTASADSVVDDSTEIVPVLVPVLTDDEKIRALIAELGDALESRDTTQLRAIYPSLDDGEAEDWSGFFKRTNNLQMSLDIGELTSSGESATAYVDGDLTYTDERGVQVRMLAFRVELLRVDREWRIDHLGRPQWVERR